MIRARRDIIDPWTNQESIFNDDTSRNILTELSSIQESVDSSSYVSLFSALTYVLAVVGMILTLVLCRFHRSTFWILVGYLRALASSVVGRTRLIVSIEVERDGITQSVVRLTERVLSQGLNTTVEHIEPTEYQAIMQTLTSQSMHPTQGSYSIPLDALARGNTADLVEGQDLDTVSFYSCHSDLL